MKEEIKPMERLKREPLRGSVHGRQRTNEVGPFERHGEKEPQRGDGGVDGPWADLLLGQMQLISAKILARGRVRRTAEKGREGPDVPDVVFLHLLLESARRHVVDHALAQRADGLVEHREDSSRMGLNPTILRQVRACALAVTPSEPPPVHRRGYRASGLVLTSTPVVR